MAGWAEKAATISGAVTSGRWRRAHSRAAWAARKMLSVPPEVMLPVTEASPPRRPATIATTSLSMRRRLGNTRSPSPFSVMKSA